MNASLNARGRRRVRMGWGLLFTLALISSWSLNSPAYAAQNAGISWSRDMAVAPERGTGTGFSVSQMELALPVSSLNLGHELLYVDFELVQTRFDWKGAAAAQNDYYWLSVPLSYRQRKYENDEFRVDLDPGFMSDPDSIGTDRIAANMAVAWRHYVRKDYFWQVGAMVDRRFGDFSPRPTLAVAWRTAKSTEVLIGFPETRIQSFWKTWLSSYLHIRPEGGIWKETIPGLGGGTERLNYRSWRAGVGAEMFWRGQLWFNAELGTQKMRNIDAVDNTGADVEATPAQSGYWQIGLIWRW